MFALALASHSPRRRDLLAQAGYYFHVFPVKVSEIIDKNLNPEAVVSQIATAKATACVQQYKDLELQGFLILSADTIVVLDGVILGKPQDFAEACAFLTQLSGRQHQVMTAICLWDVVRALIVTRWDRTDVQFRSLSSEEIVAYVQSGEPMDKAGAYAIQGEAGKFVTSFSGSWSNVVGLPLELLEKTLHEHSWSVRRHTAEST